MTIYLLFGCTPAYYVLQLVLERTVKGMKKVRQLDDRIGVLLPVSLPIMVWYFTIMTILVFDFFVTVIQICFNHDQPKEEVRKITLPLILIAFVFDIFVSLYASQVENGRILTNKVYLRMKYLRSLYFVLDMIALLIAMHQLISRVYRPFFNFLMLVKLPKIVNAEQFIKKYGIKSPALLFAYLIAKHLLLLVLVIHVVGSFFFFLDVRLIELNWYSTDMLWVYSSYAYNDIIDLPQLGQYTYAFYYAAVTLSGVAYGDLTPLNPTETLYTFFTFLFPLIFYAYIFSVIFGAISERRAVQLQAIKYRKVAKQYFRDSGINEFEALRYVNYLSYSYNKKSVDNNFMEQVAPSIKNLYVRNKFENNFDFSIFDCLAPNQVRMSEIQQIIYSMGVQEIYPSKQLINMHRSPIKLRYVVSGSFSEYIVLKQQKYNKKIGVGQFLGRFQFFSGLLPSHQSHLLETNEFTLCHSIHLDRFMKQVRNNSALFQNYHKVQIKIAAIKDVSDIGVSCFFCESVNHVVQQCHRLRVTVKGLQHLKLQARRQPYTRSKTKSIKRKQKPSQNSCKKLIEGDIVSYSLWTQTNAGQLAQAKQNLRPQEKVFELVKNWNVYFPECSF